MPKEPIRPSLGNIKPYIPGKPVEEAERELNITGIIKLASNENPLGPSPKALEAVTKYAKDIYLYPDQGSFELTRLIAEYVGVEPGNIAVGNGSDELMLNAALSYISSGDEAIISLNTFSTYETVSKLMDASIVRVNLSNLTYDLGAMLKMTGPKTKMIFICNPNSPTGTIVTQKDLDSFMSKVPQDIIVLIDEAYMEYADSPDFPDSIKYVKANKNVIVTRTFSKIYGLAGLRVGYAVARPEIIKYLNLVRMPFSVNRLAQMAGAAALADKAHVTKSKKNNAEGVAYLYLELDKLGVSYLKTQANFIFIDIKDDADGMFLELMRKGVIIRPLTSFGLPGAIRVTVGTPEQNRKFIKALSEVLNK
jgi:histidinol-phosphate aminotransferase